MTHNEFITKFNWRALDWDGVYGAQCVDLMRFYIRDVLGSPQPAPVPGAKDLWTTYNPAYYDRIPNTLTNVPQQGDIIIWNGNVGGGHGHVAIVNTANVLTFTAFSQNDPLGSYCHIQNYNNLYKNVIGWLRAKKALPPPPPPPLTDAQFRAKVREIINGPGSGDEKLDRIKAIL